MTRRLHLFSFLTRSWLALVLAGLFVASVATACSAQPSEEDFQDDFSALGWTRAFDAMHAALQQKYAFGEWKRIAWPALAGSVRARIVQAEARGDQTAYLLALRRYSQGIPDGHVTLGAAPDDPIATAARRAHIGGGFGLTVVRLDDGTVAADFVDPAGPAWRGGVRPGAAIVQWSGLAARQAVQEVDILWAATPATREVRELEQLRFLVRAPIGASARIAFRNRDTRNGRTQQAELRAEDDGYATLERTRLSFKADAVMDEPITHSILPGKIGYLRIRVLLDRDNSTFVTQLERAVQAFQTAGVKGVVIDLRGNPGGQDEWAALVGSYFYGERRLYEQVSAYDIRTHTLVPIPELTLFVEPKPNAIERPVVALVDAGTGSSAEGVAMLIEQRRRGLVMGRFSTNASFGLAGGEIRMPGNYVLRYPMAQSVDANRRVQLDSDARGHGGVAPDIPLAFTAGHLAARQAGRDVELEAALCILWWQSLFW